MFKLEHRRQALLPLGAFWGRLMRYGGSAFLGLVVWWAFGAWGYGEWADLSGTDAWLNAAMILSGMGPVDRLLTTGAKVFAMLYAAFSGVVFLGAIAFAFTPVVHRLLHKFHLDEDDALQNH
jgi:hypothetical protein